MLCRMGKPQRIPNFTQASVFASCAATDTGVGTGADTGASTGAGAGGVPTTMFTCTGV